MQAWFKKYGVLSSVTKMAPASDAGALKSE